MSWKWRRARRDHWKPPQICLTHLHLQLEGKALPLKAKVLPTEGGAEGEEEGGAVPLTLGGAEEGKFLFCAIFIAHPYPFSVI